MSDELSEEAGELVDAGKSALRPSASDKARVAAALQAKLQNLEPSQKQLVEAPPTGAASATGPWGGKFALLAGGVVISLVAAVYLNRTPAPVVPPVAVVVNPTVEAFTFEPPTAESASPTIAPEAAALERAAVAEERAAAASAGNRTSSRQVTGDSLAEEAALLGQAEKAFHAGNFTRALTLTNEHRSKFPKGVLTRERVHLRVQSLCGLGRFDEADKEQARLQKFGGSKAVKACGRLP